MQYVWFFVMACLLAPLSYANEAFEQLKARYNAIETGTSPLPELSSSNQTKASDIQAISTTPINSAMSQIPTGEELIFTATVGKLTLGEVFGYKTENGAKLSLTDFARALDFQIEIDLANRSAKGWAQSPERPFLLQSSSQDSFVITSHGQRFAASSETVAFDDDLYVEIDELKAWFDVDLSMNYRAQQMDVTSQVPLPVEQKVLRKERSAQISRHQNQQSSAPLKKSAYTPLSQPLLDIQMSASTTQYNGSSHSLSLLGANDVAYFNTKYYLATNTDDEITNAQLTFGRYSPQANLLGPLNATILEFGDVRSTNIGALDDNDTYAGLRLSNEALDYQGGNSINLRGEIQPGWDIEVYRNKLLVASSLNVTGGQYDFPNIPLVFGNNEVELVFYGPQGQINRETRNFYASSTGQEAGDFTYDFSLVNEGERLFDQFNTISPAEDRGLAAKLRAEYALSNWWSINTGAEIHDDLAYQSYDAQSFGTDIALFGQALLSADWMERTNGDYDQRYQLDTQLFNQSISYIQRHYKNTDLSTDLLTSTTTETESQYDSKAIRISGLLPGSVSYQQTFEQRVTDTKDYLRVTNQLGTNIGNSYVSNQLEWTDLEDSGVSGEWQWQRFFDGYFVRLGNQYDVTPETNVTSFYSELNTDITDTITGRLRYIHDFVQENNETRITASWQPNEFSLTSGFSYNDQTGWGASLLGQVGIGQTAENGAFFSRLPVSSQGTLSAKVYLDNNFNGVFDAGDKALKGVNVISRQSYRKASTNSEGIAILAGLPAHRKTDIELDPSSFPDPYMIRSDKGVAIEPRPGVVQNIEIPVVMSLEVEGYVYEVNQEGKQTPLSYAPVQILNSSGQVVAEVFSEFDGYYLIPSLIPDKYTLAVENSYATQKGYSTNNVIAISAKQVGVLQNQDLYLRKAFSMQGYSAQLAFFTKLESLNSYWAILTKRNPKFARYEHFYTKTSDGYRLYAGFDKSKAKANEVCQLASTIKADCLVVQLTRN